MKYSAYPEYKATEMNWLNEIPINWKLRKLRFIVGENFANGIFKKSTFWGSGRKVINVTDVYTSDDLVNQENLDRLECSDEEYEKYCVKHGDFFLVRSSLKLEGVGKSASILNPEEGTVFECHLVRGRPDLTVIDSRFLSYTLNSKYCRNYFVSIANVVTMATIDQEKFKSINLPLPLWDEQVKIAAFLDHKTIQIDRLIDKKKNLIEKLNEKRLALITQVVTQGLNPAAPMKPSGVDWLGDVPAHWKVKRLKFAASYNDESLSETTEPDYELVYIDISSVNQVKGITNYEPLTFEKAPSRARRIVRDGDTIISTVRTYLKAVAPIRNPADNTIVSTGFAVIRPNAEVNPDFLSYFALSQGFIDSVVANSKGVSYPAINATELICIPIAFPPDKLEQESIVEFLRCKLSDIDRMVTVNLKTIERLAEYRTALITAAVTGKIDVRDVVIPAKAGIQEG